LSATQNFYSLRECATRVMPALCHLIMDPEKQVRDQAFKALKGFVSKLEKVSEDPTLVEQMEADLNAAGSNVSSTLAASWAGWAVSSLAAKFYRSKPLAEQKTTSSQPTMNTNKDSSATVDKDKSDDRPLTPSTPNIQKSESGESMQDFDEDVWGSIDTNTNPNNSRRKSLDGWDNEEWNDFDSNETNSQTEIRSSSLKDEGEEFFEKFSATNTKNKSKQTKNTKNDWNSEENESWNSLNDGNDRKDNEDKVVSDYTISAVHDEDYKKKVDQRKQQRLKDMEERKARKATKGPMKLGAQRIT